VTGGRADDLTGSVGDPSSDRDEERMARRMSTMGLPVQPPSPEGRSDGLITIGVLIEVPPPFGAQLQAWRADFGDPLAWLIPAHVTLLPPTVVTDVQVDEIEEHLVKIAAGTRPFGVRLSGTDSFRPVSPVVYVRVIDGIEACDELQRRIRTGPLERELHFPFHPHVTVAHELEPSALDRAQRTLTGYAADFLVDSIGLYEHGRDGHWRNRLRFGFGLAGP
jgi:2'-5' RNA ligase